MNTPTRNDILAAAERLRRAARLLEAHAQRCTEPNAAAHAEALRQARCMVRSVVVENPHDYKESGSVFASEQ